MNKYRKSLKNLTGKRFGSLTVLHLYKRENNKTYWLCHCDCGKDIVVRADALTGGQTSCGCKRNEGRREVCRQLGYSRRTHGLSNTRLYNIWSGMKTRCFNPKCQNYKYYGGRGISICDEWLQNFNNFYSWSISNGYSETLTIDRINVDGNYSPDNCRWVDWQTQLRNKRKLCSKMGKTN